MCIPIRLEQAWAARVHRVVVGAIGLGMLTLPLGVAAPAEAGVDLLCVARTRAPEVGLSLVKTDRVSPRTRIYTFRSKAVGPDATPDGLVRVRVVLPSRYLLRPIARVVIR